MKTHAQTSQPHGFTNHLAFQSLLPMTVTLMPIWAHTVLSPMGTSILPPAYHPRLPLVNVRAGPTSCGEKWCVCVGACRSVKERVICLENPTAHGGHSSIHPRLPLVNVRAGPTSCGENGRCDGGWVNGCVGGAPQAVEKNGAYVWAVSYTHLRAHET